MTNWPEKNGPLLGGKSPGLMVHIWHSWVSVRAGRQGICCRVIPKGALRKNVETAGHRREEKKSDGHV